MLEAASSWSVRIRGAWRAARLALRRGLLGGRHSWLWERAARSSRSRCRPRSLSAPLRTFLGYS
eukprot:8070728-Alexandrium_andersonii.AAC.1